jgi:hypothetical protein
MTTATLEAPKNEAPAEPKAADPKAGAKALSNYRFVGGVGGPSRWAAHARGAVMPRWYVEQCGKHVEVLVAEGVFEATHDPVTGDFRAPPPAEGADTDEAVFEELDRLRRENERLRGEARAVTGEAEELRARVTLQVKAMGEQTTEIARYQEVTARQAVELSDLNLAHEELKGELELERATRPRPKAKPEAKAEAASK